jgi:hydroxyacylglutathione hydrolase
MASREFSSLGLERKNNSLLSKTRHDFIKFKIMERHLYPPYFRKMEEYNLEGAPVTGFLPLPAAASPEEFESLMEKGAPAVDVRSAEAYAGVSIPGSLSIPLDMLPAFAGWLLPFDKPLGLIAENHSDANAAARYLFRLGYEPAAAFLPGLYGWEVSGRSYDSIPSVHVSTLTERIEKKLNFTILDVRAEREFSEAHLPGAVNIYAGELPDNLNLVPAGPVSVFCGSGQRAIIAASVLKKSGFKDVEVCFGSMSACMELSCSEIVKTRKEA